VPWPCHASSRHDLSSPVIHHWRQDRLPAGHIVTDQSALRLPAELPEIKRRRALVHADPLTRGAGLIEGEAGAGGHALIVRARQCPKLAQPGEQGPPAACELPACRGDIGDVRIAV
jgi:GTPase involved in cell partitioning and DNA repair